MDEQTSGQPRVRKEKRRASRFPVVVFVEAKWPVFRGHVKETAQALEVSALGGLLETGADKPSFGPSSSSAYCRHTSIQGRCCSKGCRRASDSERHF
jgi:hypothetical protein